MITVLKNNLFKIDTETSTYAFKIREDGTPVHLYFGKRLSGGDFGCSDDGEWRSFCPYKKDERLENSLNVAFCEFGSYGRGDYRTPTVKIARASGANDNEFSFVGYEIVDGVLSEQSETFLPFADKKRSQTLVISLKDEVCGCILKLYYTVYENLSAITRFAKIENVSEKTVTLKKLNSFCLDITGKAHEIAYLAGTYCNETHLTRAPINRGKFVISSDYGFSGHALNPAFMLAEKNEKGETEGVYSFNLVYSGGFKAEIELDCFGRTRVTEGINDENFAFVLNGGESFISPESVLIYAETEELATRFSHEFINEKILCRKDEDYPPVLFNTWEANYFDVSEKVVCEYLGEAKALGLDMVVIDDGWFADRNDGRTGLGAWQIDENKFPHGLKPVADKVHAAGLKFGIWIEPEMGSLDCEPIVSHPDWALCAPERKPLLSRDQMVLNMANPAVVDYLEETFGRTFAGVEIDYFKWDANRYIADAFAANLTPERQGEVPYRYMLGVYELYSRLKRAFPNAIFEGCSGGGGRMDMGMLRNNFGVWASDNTDPHEREIIQYGVSRFYPAASTTVHFAAEKHGGSRRSASAKFRFAVCLDGVMGVEFDVKKLTQDQKDELKGYISEYKRLRPLVLNGTRYDLIFAENSGETAIEYLSKDKKRALVVHKQLSTYIAHNYTRLKFKDLLPGALYKAEGDLNFCLSGEILNNVGIILPYIHGDDQAIIFTLTAAE